MGYTFHRMQTAVLCLQKVTETDSIHRISQDSHWQQSGTTHILINVIHWPQRLCSSPWWFDRDGKRPSVKADLAMCLLFLGSARVKL